MLSTLPQEKALLSTDKPLPVYAEARPTQRQRGLLLSKRADNCPSSHHPRGCEMLRVLGGKAGTCRWLLRQTN